jgi:CTP synthase
VPALGAGGNELKTKPTQHAVRSMNNAGIHPDIILCRAHVPLDEERKAKLEFTCNLEKGDVLSAPNVESIYDVPVNFDAEDVGGKVLKKLGLRPRRQDLKEWRSFVSRIQGATDEVRIGIAGKYFGTGDFVLTDSYISIIEAIRHAGAAMRKKPVIDWIDAERYEKDPSLLKELSGYDGIVIPGGFGSRGVEGKIKAIEYIRTKKIPYLGLCYGMQLAVVEYARHKMGWTDANTAEIDQGTSHPVIDILPEQRKNLKEKKLWRHNASRRISRDRKERNPCGKSIPDRRNPRASSAPL